MDSFEENYFEMNSFAIYTQSQEKIIVGLNHMFEDSLDNRIIRVNQNVVALKAIKFNGKQNHFILVGAK